MGKYSKYEHKPEPKPEGVHPIWRGIGCILIILVPLISYAMSVVFLPLIVSTGYVPYEILGYIHFPDWTYRTIIIQDFAKFIGGINNLYALMILFVVFLLLLTGVFTTLYSAIYQYIGPKRYTALDAPPAKVKAKTYKR
jgi:hypothetical protein